MVKIEVDITRVSDGVTVRHTYEVEDEYADSQEFWWSEGNASCDCNRRQMFTQEHEGRSLEDDELVCGEGAFRVTLFVRGTEVYRESMIERTQP